MGSMKIHVDTSAASILTPESLMALVEWLIQSHRGTVRAGLFARGPERDREQPTLEINAAESKATAPSSSRRLRCASSMMRRAIEIGRRRTFIVASVVASVERIDAAVRAGAGRCRLCRCRGRYGLCRRRCRGRRRDHGGFGGDAGFHRGSGSCPLHRGLVPRR